MFQSSPRPAMLQLQQPPTLCIFVPYQKFNPYIFRYVCCYPNGLSYTQNVIVLLNRQRFPPETAQWNQHNAHQFRPDYKLSYLLFYSNRLKRVDLVGKLHSGVWPRSCRTIWYSSKLSVDEECASGEAYLDLEVGVPYVPREPMQKLHFKNIPIQKFR